MAFALVCCYSGKDLSTCTRSDGVIVKRIHVLIESLQCVSLQCFNNGQVYVFNIENYVWLILDVETFTRRCQV